VGAFKAALGHSEGSCASLPSLPPGTGCAEPALEAERPPVAVFLVAMWRALRHPPSLARFPPWLDARADLRDDPAHRQGDRRAAQHGAREGREPPGAVKRVLAGGRIGTLPLLQQRSGLREVRHVEALGEPPLPAGPAAARGEPVSSPHAAPRPPAPASLTARVSQASIATTRAGPLASHGGVCVWCPGE